MNQRLIKIHAFCSSKGGVGKSTLAVASAYALANEGSNPVVIDLDLTGSSLADGRELEAPNFHLDENGRFDVTSIPSGRLDAQATRRRRAIRAKHHSGSPYISLPYSNDALLARAETRVQHWLWIDARLPGVRFLPASSIRADVERSTRMLVEMPGPEWCGALLLTLRELVGGDATVTDIVLDLPPGTWGFAHAALAAIRALQQAGQESNEDTIRWLANPILVSSSDTNALVPSLEYVAAHRGRQEPDVLVVVNRSDESPEVVRIRVREKLGAILAPLGLDELLVFVDERKALRELFRGRSPIAGDVSDLLGVLRLTEQRQ